MMERLWIYLINLYSSPRIENNIINIEPRPLSERETGWICDILQANNEWKNADISRTQVVAEGPCDEGICIVLQAPGPENPNIIKMIGESVGSLWIQVNDGSIIDIQLSQFEGHLLEIYVLFVDPKHPKRRLPENWTEVSRIAVNL